MRRTPATTAIALLTLCLALAACSSAPDATGPQGTVQEFYRHLNEGDYANAMTLYSAEALELWEDSGGAAESGFADWAQGVTKSGSVDRIEIIEETLTEQAANVSFEVRYTDGSTSSHSVELVQEEGRWKMGLVG